MLNAECAEVDALLLYVASEERQPRGTEQRCLVGQVGAQVVFRLIVPPAAQQLEIARPVIVPALGQVVVAEVGIVNEVIAAFAGVEAATHTHIELAQRVELVLDGRVKLPPFIVDGGVVDTLNASFVVNGEDRPFLPGTELEAEHGCKATELRGLAVDAHGLCLVGTTLVDGETRLDVYPVEEHDVVSHAHVIVIEQFHLPSQLDSVLMLVAYFVGHAGVTGAVAVSIDHLHITVALGIVVEAQGNGEVELLVLEVVAEPGVELEEAVGIEIVFGTEAYLLRQTLAVTVA